LTGGIGDAGAVLLEVVIAMAVLAVAGIAAIAMAAEASGAVARARESEARLRSASHLLEAVALWPREELDRRLGARRQGPFVLTLQRPARELYTAVLADSAGGRVLLATSLFRRDTADAAP
jgi:type II secretory pathway pseudopilin PulG